MSFRNLKSRLFIIVGTCLGLAACGDSNVWANAWDVAKREITDADAVTITREQVENIPYASIQVIVNDNTDAPVFMVLGYIDGERLQWIASDNGSFVTRHGRLVRSVGLGEELTRVTANGGDVLNSDPHMLEAPVEYILSVESSDGKTPRSARLTCSMTPMQNQVIEIASYQYHTRRMLEQCESNSGAESENEYWVDIHSGFVWKSRQQVLNGNFTIEISVLKPYLG